MSQLCSRCGSPAPAGAVACSLCGAGLRAIKGGQPHQAGYGQRSHGWGAQQPARPPGGGPNAAGAPAGGPVPGFGMAQGGHHGSPSASGHRAWPSAPNRAGAFGPMGSGGGHPAYPNHGPQAVAPYGMAPQRSSGSGIGAGVGLAGCVGVMVVVVIVFAIAMGKHNEKRAASADQGSRAAPTSGSLRSRVPTRVGDWKVKKVAPLSGGASHVDGVTIEYMKLNKKITVTAVVFPKVSQASLWVDKLKVMTDKKFRELKITPESRPFTVKIKGKESVRTKGYRYRNQPAALIYHVEKTGTAIVGDRDEVVEFFKRFPL